MATVRKRNGKWQVQVRRQGTLPVSKTFHKKADADAWAKSVELRIDRGESSQPSIGAEATFGSLLGRYLAEIVPDKRSAAYETYLINAVARTRLSKLPLANISPEPFARYRDSRLRSVGPDVVRRELGVLQHVFSIALKEWAVPLKQNPLALVRKPKASRPRDRRLSSKELSALLEALRGSQNPWLRPVVLFALETGMRRGEIIAATWADLSAEQRILFLPETKNGHPRQVPLSKAAVAILRGLPRNGKGLIFQSTASGIQQAWQRLTRRAGIEDLHFHDLRHEAISRFFEKGLSIAEVSLISGHKDVRQLFRYTHLRPEEIVKKL